MSTPPLLRFESESDTMVKWEELSKLGLTTSVMGVIRYKGKDIAVKVKVTDSEEQVQLKNKTIRDHDDLLCKMLYRIFKDKVKIYIDNEDKYDDTTGEPVDLGFIRLET